MARTNYAVPPGAYLEEWLDEQGLSRRQVAELLWWGRKQVNEIIDGAAPVTRDIARQLEHVVGIPAGSWLRYETVYRADLARVGGDAADAR